MSNTPPRSLTARRSGALRGTARVPGDKSISHRALILGAMAVGEDPYHGPARGRGCSEHRESDERALAPICFATADGLWRVSSGGVGRLARSRTSALDFGNSGTGSRLVMGAVATTTMTAVFTGDASLRRGRPMKRVLELAGSVRARHTRAREGGLMPVTLKGARQPLAIEHEVAVASAQVKSALILAALPNAPGRSRIVQRSLTRNHTEKMQANVRRTGRCRRIGRWRRDRSR